MDNETRKKYCHLLMFDIASPASPVTPTSPCVSRPFEEITTDLGIAPQANRAREASSQERQHSEDLFVYERGSEGGNCAVSPSVQKCQLRADQPGSPYPRLPVRDASGAENGGSSVRQAIASAKKGTGKEERTPRPPNAFILYRRAVQPSIIAQHRNISNAEISQRLSHMWKNEPEHVKLQWQKEADRKKMEHMEAHPDYVYRPKKPGQKAAAKKQRARALRGAQQPNGSPAPIPTSSPVVPHIDTSFAGLVNNNTQYPLQANLMMPSPVSPESSLPSPVSPMTPASATGYWMPVEHAYPRFQYTGLSARYPMGSETWDQPSTPSSDGSPVLSFPTPGMYTYEESPQQISSTLDGFQSGASDAHEIYLPSDNSEDGERTLRLMTERFGKAFPNFNEHADNTAGGHHDSLTDHLFTFDSNDLTYSDLLSDGVPFDFMHQLTRA